MNASYAIIIHSTVVSNWTIHYNLEMCSTSALNPVKTSAHLRAAGISKDPE
jgi:hypothetical protein